jgi:hypothetical protein
MNIRNCLFIVVLVGCSSESKTTDEPVPDPCTSDAGATCIKLRDFLSDARTSADLEGVVTRITCEGLDCDISIAWPNYEAATREWQRFVGAVRCEATIVLPAPEDTRSAYARTMQAHCGDTNGFAE